MNSRSFGFLWTSSSDGLPLSSLVYSRGAMEAWTSELRAEPRVTALRVGSATSCPGPEAAGCRLREPLNSSAAMLESVTRPFASSLCAMVSDSASDAERAASSSACSCISPALSWPEVGPAPRRTESASKSMAWARSEPGMADPASEGGDDESELLSAPRS